MAQGPVLSHKPGPRGPDTSASRAPSPTPCPTGGRAEQGGPRARGEAEMVGPRGRTPEAAGLRAYQMRAF